MPRITPYPLTPIGSFIGIILSMLPPLLHHGSRSWNAIIWVYAFWVGLMNTANFVNTIIWRDNVDIVVPVWCDIVTKLQTGAAIGVPACALALCIHVFRVAPDRSAALVDEKTQKRQALLFNLTLTVGVPVLVVALWIIAQPYRFSLFEEIGCQSVGYSYVAYILDFGPQLVFCIAAAAITPFAFKRYCRNRERLAKVLFCDKDVNPAACIRVVIITCLTLILDLPILIIQLATHIAQGDSSLWNFPYKNWAWVHDGSINEVIQTPADVWGSFKWQVFSIKWNEWIYVFHAIVFFAVFGTTPGARKKYVAAVRFVLAKIGLKVNEPKKIPVHETRFKTAFDSSVEGLKQGMTTSLVSSSITTGDQITTLDSLGSIEEGSRYSCASMPRK